MPDLLFAQSLVNTVHNLSVSGPGNIKASSESDICIFCHTPHTTSPRKPLWNRPDPGHNYTTYRSSTNIAVPGQPTGGSILCLSCHDGTIALGNILSQSSPISFSGGITTMPGGYSNLNTDLSDDHPISFTYNSALASANGELADPGNLNGSVHLDDNQQLQCTSCHDPHKNNYSNFLTASNRYSDLCLYCHQKSYWNTSSHKTSPATWNGSGNDPWFHTSYSRVSENACENCHNPHNAEGHDRLMNYYVEESNCLSCHNGNVASKNIENQLSKTYTHNIYSYNQIHDPNESNLVQTKHVECVDCHNPHSSRNTSATAPNANGFIAGVKGVDSNGNSVNPVQFEYELCYRCHADSPDKPGSPVSRNIEQNNVRLEFDQSNPSFHPVEGPGKNSNVPSLISPLNVTSVIYCTDCHASDGSAPEGPHGSIFPHILKYRYQTTVGTNESYQNYRLCYECHNRNSIINGMGNFARRVHRKHIVGEDVPCNVCHDPHGVSANQGTTLNNSHLINFDLSQVQPEPNSGKLEFQDLGNFRGRCYLLCHGKRHNPASYH